MRTAVTTDTIQAMIARTVARSSENRLGPGHSEPAFGAPLVGCSSGADPLYQQYVEHIGSFYLTPLRIFETAFPEDAPIAPQELTVISWILPSTAATRKEQSEADRRPSERWARTRLFGERFNETLRREIVAALSDAGVPAVAPMLTEFWERRAEGPYAPCSNWSERHAAYAAGLGTFGLCDGLITPLGKAVRIGSVVARIALPPSKRPYADHHDYCLHYAHGTCGKCIERCPVNALSRKGHHKQRCMEYTEHGMRGFMRERYGLDTYACGLCQAAVPCMDHIPTPEEG